MSLKENALHYFQSKAAVYNERYAVRAGGDLLWVRHNALLEIARSWGLPPGSQILDLGCGPGLLTRDLARRGYFGTGIDASSAMIDRCRAQAVEEGLDSWVYRLGDVEALPLTENSFDVVVCSGVIDYLDTDDKILTEAARVLKPQGRLLFCFTNKYGYTVCLSSFMYWVKKIPGMNSIARRLRSALVGGNEGAMSFSFLPRKHRPQQARMSLARHGFRFEGDRYVHFSLFPAPFCAIASRLTFNIDEKLNGLQATPLRFIGSCYIVRARLEK